MTAKTLKNCQNYKKEAAGSDWESLPEGENVLKRAFKYPVCLFTTIILLKFFGKADEALGLFLNSDCD